MIGPLRKGRTRRIRRPEAPLLPKLFAAFVLILALSTTATLLLENRLTRSALQTQAERLVVDDLDVVAANFVSTQSLLATQVRTTAEGLSRRYTSAGEEARVLGTAVADLSRSALLDVVTVFDDRGRVVASTGLRISPPPPEVLAALGRRGAEGIVPVGDGRYAQVVATPMGRPEQPRVLVAGHRFDDARALELRDLTGSEDVILVIDGEVVGSTDPTLDGREAPGDPTDASRPQSVEIDAREVLVGYHELSPAPGWGETAAVGLLSPEPLGLLDASLGRNRVLIALILVASAAVLSLALARVMTRPLHRLADTARAIAAGDLDARFELEATDEVGMLARSLERMRQGIRTQLEVIRRQAEALREAARRVVNVQDEERRRLARDLHDGIQQQLVMLRLRVGFAQSNLEREPESAHAALEELGNDIEEIIARLRETSQDIFPSILHDRGLSGALHSLASRSAVPIEVTAAPMPLPRFSTSIETNAYFLVAEAVTNALKHAEPDRLEVGAVLDQGRLRITVADNGRGLASATRIQDGGGLSHMRDRVRALGGTLHIRSSRDEGTRIDVAIPVPSVGAPLQEEEDGGDAPVEVDLLTEVELPEDGVGVFLD